MTLIALSLAFASLPFAGLAWLAWLGMRLGDRDDDALSHVDVTWISEPDGWMLFATMAVDNLGPSTLVVAVDPRRSFRVPWDVRQSRSVRLPISLWPPRPPTGTILGAVSGRSTQRWSLALPNLTRAPMLKIAVGLYQGGRYRVHTHLMNIPSLPPVFI